MSISLRVAGLQLVGALTVRRSSMASHTLCGLVSVRRAYSRLSRIWVSSVELARPSRTASATCVRARAVTCSSGGLQAPPGLDLGSCLLVSLRVWPGQRLGCSFAQQVLCTVWPGLRDPRRCVCSTA